MSGLSHRALAKRHSTHRTAVSSAPGAVANAYDHVGVDYICYADGDSAGGLDDPSAAESRFAHADAIVWKAIRTAIDDLSNRGVATLRVLDAGCGPGTWLRRIASYADRIGMGIEATGVDISNAQLEIARRQTGLRPSCGSARTRTIDFHVHDLADPLPWTDGQFHLVLCNYVVLNHLDVAAMPNAVRELCRVASDRVIATVRSIASAPTGCITGTEKVSRLRHDNQRGELVLVLKDGSQHRLTFNLFSAESLRVQFEANADVLDLRAVDIFVSRFAPNAQWTAGLMSKVGCRDAVARELVELEERYCRQPGWVDHGSHVLIVTRGLRRA